MHRVPPWVLLPVSALYLFPPPSNSPHSLHLSPLHRASVQGVSHPKPCPAGYSSPGGVVPECIICDFGKYSASARSVSCEQCPGGRTTPIQGAPTADYCLTLSVNYTTGTLTLLAAIVIFYVYMVQGRMFQIAFLRRRVRKVLVSQCRMLYKKMRKNLLDHHVVVEKRVDEDQKEKNEDHDQDPATANQQVQENQNVGQVKEKADSNADAVAEKAKLASQLKLKKAWRGFRFLLGSGFIVVFCIIFGYRTFTACTLSEKYMYASNRIHSYQYYILYMTCSVLWTMQAIFFNAFILWRSTISQAIERFLNEEFIVQLRGWVSSLGWILLGIEPLVRVLFYPILAVVSFLENLRVDQILGNLNVTCNGSIAPIRLVFDVYIFGMVIIIIQSEFLLISLARKKLNLFYLETFASPDFRSRVIGNVLSLITSLGAAYAIDTTALYKAFLRYLMTLLAIAIYFPAHPYTEACSATPPLGFDTALACLATVCAYLFMYPTWYTIGRICTPSSIDKGLKSILLRGLEEMSPSFKKFISAIVMKNNEELDNPSGKIRLAIQRFFSIISFDLWVAHLDCLAIGVVKICGEVKFKDPDPPDDTPYFERVIKWIMSVRQWPKNPTTEGILLDSRWKRTLWGFFWGLGVAVWHGLRIVLFVLYDFFLSPCLEAATAPFEEEHQSGSGSVKVPTAEASALHHFDRSVFVMLELGEEPDAESAGSSVTTDQIHIHVDAGSVKIGQMQECRIEANAILKSQSISPDVRAEHLEDQFKRLNMYDVPSYMEAIKLAWTDWMGTDRDKLAWYWRVLEPLALILIASGPGIVCTQKGLQSLVRIVDKYLSLAQVVLGVWDENNSHAYEIHEKIDEYCNLNNATLATEYDAPLQEKESDFAAPEAALKRLRELLQACNKDQKAIQRSQADHIDFRPHYDAMLKAVTAGLWTDRATFKQKLEERLKMEETEPGKKKDIDWEKLHAGSDKPRSLIQIFMEEIDWTKRKAGDGDSVLRAVALIELFFSKGIQQKWVSVLAVDELGFEIDALLGAPDKKGPSKKDGDTHVVSYLVRVASRAAAAIAPSASESETKQEKNSPMSSLGAAERQEFFKHFESCLEALHLPMLKKEEVEWRLVDEEREDMSDYQSMLGGMLSTRAILFQIIQGGAFFSVFASYLAITPLLLMDDAVDIKQREAILREQLFNKAKGEEVRDDQDRPGLSRQTSGPGLIRSLSNTAASQVLDLSEPYSYTVLCDLVISEPLVPEEDGIDNLLARLLDWLLQGREVQNLDQQDFLTRQLIWLRKLCKHQDYKTRMQNRLLARCVKMTSTWSVARLQRFRQTVENHVQMRSLDGHVAEMSGSDVLEAIGTTGGQTLAAKLPAIVEINFESDDGFSVKSQPNPCPLSKELTKLMKMTQARYVKPQLLRTIKDVSDFFSLSRSLGYFFGLSQFCAITVLFASVVNPLVPVRGVLYFIGKRLSQFYFFPIPSPPFCL